MVAARSTLSVVEPTDLPGSPAATASAPEPPTPGGTAPTRRPAAPSPAPPSAMPKDAAAQFPETFRYRVKNRLLGPPLTTDRLATERLGRPTALAVLSSDVISSSAYATEQALIPLIQVIGMSACSVA